MNYKITVFEDNKLAPLNYYSGKEIEALENIISNYHSGEKDLPYLINDEETSYGLLYNVDEEKIKKYENKKISIDPPQYGSNPWGKVEILFEKDDSIHNNDKIKSKNPDTIKLNKNKEVAKNKVEKSKSKKTELEANKEVEKPISKKTEAEANKEVSKDKVEKPKSKKTEVEVNEEVSKDKVEKPISKKTELEANKEVSKNKVEKSKSKKTEVEANKEVEKSKSKKTEAEANEKVSKEKVNINDKDNSTLISTNTDSSQKKIRKCSNCKELGHNIRKCPLINK